MIVYKQLLGDISQSEVWELTQNLGLKQGSFYYKSRKEPATITAWKIIPFGALWTLGAVGAVYAKFIRGYNILWFVAPFVPLWTYWLYAWARQPTQELENGYKYLLAKRAATCELEKNRKRFNELPFAKSKELHDLQAALRNRDITIYQLEGEIIDGVNAGSFK